MRQAGPGREVRLGQGLGSVRFLLCFGLASSSLGGFGCKLGQGFGPCNPKPTGSKFQELGFYPKPIRFKISRACRESKRLDLKISTSLALRGQVCEIQRPLRLKVPEIGFYLERLNL